MVLPLLLQKTGQRKVSARLRGSLCQSERSQWRMPCNTRETRSSENRYFPMRPVSLFFFQTPYKRIWYRLAKERAWAKAQALSAVVNLAEIELGSSHVRHQVSVQDADS